MNDGLDLDHRFFDQQRVPFDAPMSNGPVNNIHKQSFGHVGLLSTLYTPTVFFKTSARSCSLYRVNEGLNKQPKIGVETSRGMNINR